MMYYSNPSTQAFSGPMVNEISSMRSAAPASFNVAVNAHLPCLILSFQRESS
jgi:hypothetical protein